MIVMVNISWMRHYAGASAADPCIGGFAYVKENDDGHEAWNFTPWRGRVYGHIPGDGRIRIKNLGATADQDRVDGVTVVWMARHPQTRKLMVVGWFRNATIHRDTDTRCIPRPGYGRIKCQIEADPRDATLIPENSRHFAPWLGPRERGPGRNAIWYGGTNAARNRILRYVQAGGQVLQRPAAKAAKRKPTNGRGARQPDTEKRQRVENAAMDHAMAYYRSPAGGSRHAVDVSAKDKGWDIEATIPGTRDTLHVEVKGLSGNQLSVELTPNEFDKMTRHFRTFVIYVVTDALGKQPHARRFRCYRSRTKRAWRDESGQALKITKRIGARLQIK